MSDISRVDQNAIPDVAEIRLFAKIRNEADRLPYFLSFYRKRGVARFFFIDNGSTDGTLDYLRSLPDCHIFYTTDKLKESRAGMDWIQPLLNEYGRDRWCIVVDADELLVYPDYETKSLPEFCATLDQRKANAFLCMLLDMYPDGPIDQIKYRVGQAFWDVCPLFDKSGYRWIKEAQETAPVIHGGPRIRMFYPELLDRRLHVRLKRRLLTYCGRIIPHLKPATPFPINKVPLVRWNETMRYGDAAHDISGATLADGFGVLMHFKFLGDFEGRVKEELNRQAYLGQEDYQKYSEGLRNGHLVNFKCDISAKFTGSRQLLELGLIKDI